MSRLSRRGGDTRGQGATPVGWPHREQKAASSPIWKPHLVQNISVSVTPILRKLPLESSPPETTSAKRGHARGWAASEAIADRRALNAYKTGSNGAVPGSPAAAAPGTVFRASPVGGRSFCCDRAADPLLDPF